MPLDPDVRRMLDRLADQPDISTLTVEAARARFRWRWPSSLRVDPVADVRDAVLPGRPALPVRVYRPLGRGPHPVLVFFHGSGFVVSDLDTHDPMCRNLAAGAGCVVVSVDYRLAPEHRFPAASDDCLAATRAVAALATDLGGMSDRIVVGGDSAGGNLAAVTALRIRDEGGPALCGQLLIYPVTDFHEPGTRSYAENAMGYGLTRQAMAWFWGHYLPDPTLADDPRACPLRAPSLAGLPSAYVSVAEYDPLRDEGVAYGRRLEAEGVEVTLSQWAGVHHGFFFFPGVIAKADAALDEACAWLRRAFAAAL